MSPRTRCACSPSAPAARAIAGSLYAHYLDISPIPAPFGLDATIAQLTALTAGGFLSLWGAYVGSAIVVALSARDRLIVGSTASQLVAGLQYLTFGLLLICIVQARCRRSARASANFPRCAGGGRAPAEAAVTRVLDVQRFRSGSAACAQSTTSIALERSEILGLVGPNGAGKTTIFNAVSAAC